MELEVPGNVNTNIEDYQLDIPIKEESSSLDPEINTSPKRFELTIPKPENTLNRIIDLPMIDGSLHHQCKICGRLFTDKLSLRVHRKEHETGKCFPCNICGKLYSYHSALIAHKKIHLGHKQFKCEICNCEFYYQSALCAHRKTHSVSNLYSCNICGKVFFYQSSLCAHRKIHTSATPNSYTCELCGKTFSWLSGLCAHRKNYHQNPNRTAEASSNGGENSQLNSSYVTPVTKKHTCLTCGKMFSWQSGLCAHRRKQHPELYAPNRIINMPTNQFVGQPNVSNINADIAALMGGNKYEPTSAKQFTCDICNISFPNRVEFFTHKIRHRQSVGTVSNPPTASSQPSTSAVTQNLEKLHQMIMFMNTSRLLAANAFAAAYPGSLFPYNPSNNYAMMARAMTNSTAMKIVPNDDNIPLNLNKSETPEEQTEHENNSSTGNHHSAFDPSIPYSISRNDAEKSLPQTDNDGDKTDALPITDHVVNNIGNGIMSEPLDYTLPIKSDGVRSPVGNANSHLGSGDNNALDWPFKSGKLNDCDDDAQMSTNKYLDSSAADGRKTTPDCAMPFEKGETSTKQGTNHYASNSADGSISEPIDCTVPIHVDTDKLVENTSSHFGDGDSNIVESSIKQSASPDAIDEPVSNESNIIDFSSSVEHWF